MTDRRTVHDTLADRAYLHDDPQSYLAGVDDAVAEAGERAGPMGHEPPDDRPDDGPDDRPDDGPDDEPAAVASRA